MKQVTAAVEWDGPSEGLAHGMTSTVMVMEEDLAVLRHDESHLTSLGLSLGETVYMQKAFYSRD
jgi:hypothetical protein